MSPNSNPAHRTVEEAEDQAAAYYSFIKAEYIDVEMPDGTVESFKIPNPALLGDEQQERYDKLQFDIQQCDRHPDLVIPDHKLDHKVTHIDGEVVTVGADGVVTGGSVRVEESETFVPGRTIRGQAITPYQSTADDGTTTVMSPGYNARLAIALWGEEGYARFKAGGGNSRLINLIWTRMNQEAEDRKAADSKSDGSNPDMEAVPQTD